MSYQLVPTSEGEYPYPPVRPGAIGPSLKPRHQLKHWSVLKYALGLVAIFTWTHYAILGAFPTIRYSRHFRPELTLTDAIYEAAKDDAARVLDKLNPAAGQPGTFFRDSYPIRSMLAFWELAEREVEERGLDTCKGQLSSELIDAYHRSHMAYCLPAAGHNGTTASKIWCAPVHRDEFSKWWPYPAAPCLSANIRPVAGSERKYIAAGCSVTTDGLTLLEEMDRERFLGNDLARVDPEPSPCREVLDRTAIVIGRQDQWNP
jgi:hypothetical protein